MPFQDLRGRQMSPLSSELTDQDVSSLLTKVFEQVSIDVNLIEQKLKNLERAQNRRLKFQIDLQKVHEDERKITNAVIETNDLFRSAENGIHSIAHLKAQATSENLKSIINNFQREKAQELQQLSIDFQKMQSKHRDRLQAQKNVTGIAALDFKRTGTSNSSSQEAVDEQAQATKEESKVTDLEYLDHMLMDEADLVMLEREEEIAKITTAMQEINQIFQELNAIVVDQGLLVDRIDYNIEMAAERAKRGLKEVQRAEKHQKGGCSIQ